MKSYVTMEQRQCMVCGQMYDTGALLMDRRLHNKFERHTCTGQGLCPEDKKLADDGYVAVVAMSANRSTFLGAHVHIKRDVWEKVFNIPAPKVLAHCSMDVIEMLKAQHESQTPV